MTHFFVNVVTAPQLQVYAYILIIVSLAPCSEIEMFPVEMMATVK